jgi:hypothetical protein
LAHGFQLAGAVPAGAGTAYDLSSTVDPTSWYGTLLAATANLTPSATVLEISIWLAYVIVVLALFFDPPGRGPPRRAWPRRPWWPTAPPAIEAGTLSPRRRWPAAALALTPVLT